MHFDDRLATVLRARIGSEAAARVQYRQLIDLLGTMPSEARGPNIDAAHVRLAELNAVIPAPVQVQLLSRSGLRMRSPRLLAELAHGDPRVAEEAISIARLTESEWLDLIPALPPMARTLVRSRTDLGPNVETLLGRLGIANRGLPPAGTGAQVAANDSGSANVTAPAEGIGAIVQRIEAYRKRKMAESALAAKQQAPAPMPVQPIAAITFACDEAGRITWSDVGTPGLFGLSINAPGEATAAEPSSALRDSFRARQPLRGVTLVIAGGPAVSGTWQVDALPHFDSYGRFAGYQGRLRRPTPPSPRAVAQSGEADRIRQLLHELRTPVNAIQGFAEVIQQQLFGPTPHEYRAHAAAIAGDAARMLAGFEDLERLAKLASGAMTLEEGQCDCAEVVRNLVSQLNAHGEARASGFVLSGDDQSLPVAIAHPEAERLAWRLLATLAGACAPGEKLDIVIGHFDGRLAAMFALPASLVQQDDILQTAATPNPGALSTGMFGTGFALRLAMSEARAAGGKLEQQDGALLLDLPLVANGLTGETSLHTPNQGMTG